MATEITQDEVTINGVSYVRKGTGATHMAPSVDGLIYVIVRTAQAGVHAGYVGPGRGTEMTVFRARRLWYWSGAASLSQLAVDGVKNPKDCKFPVEVDEVFLTGVIEVIPATQKALDSIAAVKVWSA